MLFNAFLITFLYNRLGRSETRGAQVVFSQKALVTNVDGQVRFQMRAYDVDAQRPVVEAHVRLYVVTKDRPVPRPLRVLQPDDEMGATLFLSFPSVISHHIDVYSLLHPPTPWPLSVKYCGLLLRSADGATNNRDDCVCPICGESYGTVERWRNHVRYQQIVERKDGYPVEGTHLSLNMDDIEAQIEQQPTTDLEELRQHFESTISEVICVVEGIDPLMSGTFQSLHSYRAEDIIWDQTKQFAPCLEVVDGKKGQLFQLDLDRYHDFIQVAAEASQKPKKRRRYKQVSQRHGDSLFSTNPKRAPRSMQSL
jgi:hypothetical protein